MPSQVTIFTRLKHIKDILGLMVNLIKTQIYTSFYIDFKNLKCMFYKIIMLWSISHILFYNINDPRCAYIFYSNIISFQYIYRR